MVTSNHRLNTHGPNHQLKLRIAIIGDTNYQFFLE